MKPAILERTNNGFQLHNFTNLDMNGTFTLKWGFSKLVFQATLFDSKPASCEVKVENGLITDPIVVEVIKGFCTRKFTSFVFHRTGLFYMQSPVFISDDYEPDYDATAREE